MTRTLVFLLTGWTMIFIPAFACSRSNNISAVLPARVDPGKKKAPDTVGAAGYTYLALGDSYTIATAVGITSSYPVQTVQQLGTLGIHFADPAVVATNGWTTTNLLAALLDKSVIPAYNIVTLLIGVNNEYQGGSLDNYHDQFTELLQKSIVYAGNRPDHVIVLSIPDYGVTPFGKGRDQAAIASGIDAFNKVNKEITLAFGAQYLNITDESRAAGHNPALLAADGLHYSAAEYAVWAKSLVPLIRGALGN